MQSVHLRQTADAVERDANRSPIFAAPRNCGICLHGYSVLNLRSVHCLHLFLVRRFRIRARACNDCSVLHNAHCGAVTDERDVICAGRGS